jgi:hypothetical protein
MHVQHVTGVVRGRVRIAGRQNQWQLPKACV